MEPQKVQLHAVNPETGEVRPIWVDDLFGALRVIDHVHSEIHAGDTFAASDEIDTTASGGGTFDILVRTPNVHPVHVGLWDYTITSSVGKVEMYEGVGFDDPGTNINPHNMNRIVGDHEDYQTEVRVTKNPTSVNISQAEELEVKKIIGGKHTGGGAESPLVEWVLKHSSSYLLRFTNEDNTDDAEGTFTIRWYEFETGDSFSAF